MICKAQAPYARGILVDRVLRDKKSFIIRWLESLLSSKAKKGWCKKEVEVVHQRSLVGHAIGKILLVALIRAHK